MPGKNSHRETERLKYAFVRFVTMSTDDSQGIRKFYIKAARLMIRNRWKQFKDKWNSASQTIKDDVMDKMCMISPELAFWLIDPCRKDPWHFPSCCRRKLMSTTIQEMNNKELDEFLTRAIGDKSTDVDLLPVQRGHR